MPNIASVLLTRMSVCSLNTKLHISQNKLLCRTGAFSTAHVVKISLLLQMGCFFLFLLFWFFFTLWSSAPFFFCALIVPSSRSSRPSSRVHPACCTKQDVCTVSRSCPRGLSQLVSVQPGGFSRPRSDLRCSRRRHSGPTAQRPSGVSLSRLLEISAQ